MTLRVVSISSHGKLWWESKVAIIVGELSKCTTLDVFKSTVPWASLQTSPYPRQCSVNRCPNRFSSRARSFPFLQFASQRSRRSSLWCILAFLSVSKTKVRANSISMRADLLEKLRADSDRSCHFSSVVQGLTCAVIQLIVRVVVFIALKHAVYREYA